MMNVPTPHISAVKGDFAPTVLMPGDPLRSKYIAERYLIDAVMVNNVRGVQGYTGTYQGIRLSVMASGMGLPSMGIYSHELFCGYEVQNIIRIGSAGSLQETVRLRDLVIAQGVSTDSNWGDQFHVPGAVTALADYTLLEICVKSIRRMEAAYHVGNVLSSQYFYNDDGDLPIAMRPTAVWAKMGLLAVEMEALALYLNAARYGGRALALCTISDNLLTGESLSAQERQDSFHDMMEVALQTALELE